jgi:hypothetical protein
MKRYLVILIVAAAFACKKDRTQTSNYPPRHVLYLVKGTQIKMNFIDSNSGFQRDQLFSDSFRYEFSRKPGTGIGISVGVASPQDTIYSWEIRIDGKLTANAFSVGGAYLSIPYF